MLAPETTQAPHARGEWIAGLLIRVVKVYWYVLTVFAGAGLAAFFASWIDSALPQLISRDWPQRAQHIGRVLGAVLAAIGQPLGWFSISVGKVSSTSPQATQEPTSQQVVNPSPSHERRPLVQALRYGLLIGVVGALFGTILGTTLAGVWMSISLSPWAPTGWAESITMSLGGVSASHWVPFAGYLGSVMILGVVGLLLGLIGTPLGWVKVESMSDSQRRQLRSKLQSLLGPALSDQV